MADESTNEHPTWIYAADGGAKIVNLAPGADAPEGWSRDIAIIKDQALATAEAVTARAEGRDAFRPDVVEVESVLAEVALNAVPAEMHDAAIEQIAALTADIAKRDEFIAKGMAENEQLLAEVEAAEKQVAAAAEALKAAHAEIAALTAQLDAVTAPAKPQAKGGK